MPSNAGAHNTLYSDALSAASLPDDVQKFNRAKRLLQETRELMTIQSEIKKSVDGGTALLAELRTINVAVAEANVEASRTETRRQLADIVAIREQELNEARDLFGAKKLTQAELRKAEDALAEAKARLAKAK